MANQQASAGGNIHPSNNDNMNIPDPLLRSTFVIQPDSSSSTRNNETLRSRSADSRPPNTSTVPSTTEDDDADWIDLPSMDMPMPPPPPPPQLPTPPVLHIPRIRGPAIIRMSLPKEKERSPNISILESIDRSLPCASPYFTQTLRPPFDNPNNAANLTPTEAAALNNASNRAVIFATGPQRSRGRHRHPAGPWAQQTQQQAMPNFMLSSPGAPTGVTGMTPGGHAYNMTAHSFEIPMVISTTTTAEIPQPAASTGNVQQQPSANDGQQAHMVTDLKTISLLIYLFFFCSEYNYQSGTFTNYTWCFTKWKWTSSMYVPLK